jgi:hypothetical protein
MGLTRCERDAVVFQIEYECTKVAADRRCVSEHTQKNQIKSAMTKLDANTQIGLIKAFFGMFYGVRFDIREARQMTAMFLLVLFLLSIRSVEQATRRARRGRRRNETELVIFDL